MAYVIDSDACTSCGSCIDVCPVDAITNKSGIIEIDEDRCIDCGACEGECPVSAIGQQW